MMLEFASSTARSEFMARIEDKAPQFIRQIKASFSQPTLVTVSRAHENQTLHDVVQSLAGADVKIFEDKKMDIMGG